MNEPVFMPGLELARRYWEEAIRPILSREFPGLSYAAGLLGEGSDVLGFATGRSMDHDWGPRLTLFLRAEDLELMSPQIDDCLHAHLPRTFLGFATGVGFHPDGATRPAAEGESFQHRISITSPKTMLHWLIGIESIADLTPAVWITASQQKLLELTAGEIFYDGTDEITGIRAAFDWYPDDVWRYVMAGVWKRIAQVEPFVGRCGEVGDDLGSQLVAMSLVRDIMCLAFLQERRYAPYPKWFGTAFSRLEMAPNLTPLLDRARFARDWKDREAGIVDAVVMLAEQHNRLGVTPPLDSSSRRFWTRPFQVLDAERFTRALEDSITDPAVRSLPRDLGGVDTWIDSTDALGHLGLLLAVRAWIDGTTATPD